MTGVIESPAVRIYPRPDGQITVEDKLSGGRLTVDVDANAALSTAEPDWFIFPVDVAVTFETATLTVPNNVSVSLREEDGEFRGAVTWGSWSLDGRATYLDVDGALKTYVYIDDQPAAADLELSLTADGSTVVRFESPVRLVLGVRSHHERPAATITIPDDPHGLVEALPYLASGIKEWSVERSWPSLRSHPPRIELGETLHVPERLSKPDTDVEVAVPPRWADLYQVAPLVYYLGATVVAGEEPELRVGTGFTERLGSGAALEARVDELLTQCFILDSLVRVEGYYGLPRYEYDELAGSLPFYPPALYDQPIRAQLLEYLEVSYETIEPVVPEWPLTAVVRPTAADAEHLPALLDRLARVRVDAPTETPAAADHAGPCLLTGYTGQEPGPGEAALPGQAWASIADHEFDLASGVSVTLVDDDGSLTGTFDRSDWDAFGIDSPHPTLERRRSVTCAELLELLKSTDSYLHYGNGVTESGFVCSDGVVRFEDLPPLDGGVVSLDWTGSADPGRELVAAGAMTAVLVDDGDLTGAERLAQYLALGYPVALAARLAEVAESCRYVGDATTGVVTAPNALAPAICEVTSTSVDRHHLRLKLTHAPQQRIGSVGQFDLDAHHDTFQFDGATVETPLSVSTSELLAFAETNTVCRLNGTVHHDGPLTREAVRHSAARHLRSN